MISWNIKFRLTNWGSLSSVLKSRTLRSLNIFSVCLRKLRKHFWWDFFWECLKGFGSLKVNYFTCKLHYLASAKERSLCFLKVMLRVKKLQPLFCLRRYCRCYNHATFHFPHDRILKIGIEVMETMGSKRTNIHHLPLFWVVKKSTL